MDKFSILYQDLVSPYFKFDKKGNIYGIRYEENEDRIFIYLRFYADINDERYINYHCWIVPNESLNINSSLFLLLTCTGNHKGWMDKWATEIFEKSSKCDKEQAKKFKMQCDAKEKEISSIESNKIKNRNRKKKRNDDANFVTVHYDKVDNSSKSVKKKKMNPILFIAPILLIILILLLFIIFK